MKLVLSQKTSVKSSNLNFRKNLPSGSRIVLRGRTDRHDEAASPLLQFCERAKHSTCITVR